jgi:uncharacterized membrane protein
MPPVHPMLVHFPIALVIAALILGVVSRIWDIAVLHRVAMWNLIVGTVTAIPAVLTGLAAEENVFTLDPEYKVLEVHQTMAFISLGLLVLLSLWAIIGFKKWERTTPVVFLIGLVIGAGSVGVTGYFGGELVFQYRVGVQKETIGDIPLQGSFGELGYRCPVHRDLTSAKPGFCPKCGKRMIPILNLPEPRKVKKQQPGEREE